ncbi:MAG: hypothetical protein HY786_06540 [Deltaproteobacteria bacterium]|nr:hypothetical protein [Deltaproteobacteria bacterium]
MNKITKFTGMLFVAAIMTFAFSSESQAVPAFARQVGVSCTTCHFQHYPALNAFGRAFKASGYTQIGSQAQIEYEGLSLPATLNASLVTKIRLQQTDGDTKTGTDGDIGELQFPDEAALLIGGRAGEHVGFLGEFALGNGVDSFTTFKMPFSFEVGPGHFEFVPYVTDALGASVGFEVLNTGAVRNIRTFEERDAVSAQQYIGTATAAKGFAFVYYTDMFHVNASLWGPDSSGTTPLNSLRNYRRVAATPQVAGWDLGVGAQLWGGTTELADSATTPTKFDSRATAIDFQAQGYVGAMPLGVYVTVGSADKSSASSTNLFNSSTTDATTATAVSAELGVVPSKVTVGAGYRAGSKGGKSDTANLIGATYQVAQNVQVQLNYMMLGGDAHSGTGVTKNQTTLMLFSAF